MEDVGLAILTFCGRYTGLYPHILSFCVFKVGNRDARSRPKSVKNRINARSAIRVSERFLQRFFDFSTCVDLHASTCKDLPLPLILQFRQLATPRKRSDRVLPRGFLSTQTQYRGKWRYFVRSQTLLSMSTGREQLIDNFSTFNYFFYLLGIAPRK